MLIVFTGQGSQKPNMWGLCNQFSDFAEYVDMLSQTIDINIKHLLINANEEDLKQNAQIAIFTIGYFLGKKFIEKISNASTENSNQSIQLAGHSLGQYIALALSNIIQLESCIKLIAERTKVMSEITRSMQGSMAALVDCTIEIAAMIASLASCNQENCYIANINSATQIVISGNTNAIKRALEIAKQFSKRSIQLQTSGPFHTPYMRPAADKLNPFIENLEFSKPKFEVISNVFVDTDISWKEEAKMHMISIVRWAETIKKYGTNNKIIEIGPAPVLSKLAAREGFDATYFSEYFSEY